MPQIQERTETMKIIDSILTKNDCYKANRQITVKGLLIHSVGCPQPSAMVFINQWNKPASEQGGRQVCVHGFIDGNTGDVYKTLPWNWRAWHCGSGANGSGNNTHVGVEICEPATIKYTGGASWVDNNPENTKAVVMRTYQSAVELFAMLCKEFSLDPLADGVIISHAEGYKRGIASNHGDVEHLWGKFGLTMAQFRKDVQAAQGNATATPPSTTTPEPPPPVETPSGVIYRVQTGAFTSKANADNLLTEIKSKGFDAFVTFTGGYHKVQVGAYSVKTNADAMLAKLKGLGYDAFITSNTGQSQPSQTPSLSLDEVAREVIAGKWGNGQERVQKLTAAGYDANAVQARVNQLAK